MAVNKAMNILIVDDYKTMLKIIRSLLQQLGFNNVDEAISAPDALALMEKKEYGLIISDWNMEPMTGLEFLQKIRTTEKTKALPFIMITAESKTENVIIAKKAGVSNYIVKPFTANILKEKMTSVLGAF
jgi:two-component system chemotaxis response regulator CheY